MRFSYSYVFTAELISKYKFVTLPYLVESTFTHISLPFSTYNKLLLFFLINPQSRPSETYLVAFLNKLIPHIMHFVNSNALNLLGAIICYVLRSIIVFQMFLLVTWYDQISAI